MKHSILVVCALTSALGLQAQIPASHITEGKNFYNVIKGFMTSMANNMPEENYSFKPTPDIRTFAQMVAHVADTQAGACSTAAGSPKRIGAASKTTKADLVAALKQSFDMCDAAWDGLTEATAAEPASFGPFKGTKLFVLEFNTSHSYEEYGYMSIYLRLKGIVPPSSEGRGGRGR
jgi:DinB superfamily